MTDELKAWEDMIRWKAEQYDKLKWIPVKFRKLTEEEKKQFEEEGFEEAWDCKLPDDGQEVLISTTAGVQIDTFCIDNLGVYFESTDAEYIKAWMPLPDPYQEEKEMPPKDKEKINEIENSPLQIISFERAEERDCKSCKHYVKQNEGNTEALFGEIYGCEKWECKFEGKEEEEP